MHPKTIPLDSLASPLPPSAPTRSFDRNSGAMISPKIPTGQRVTLTLSFPTVEADKLRRFVTSIKLKEANGTPKAAPMALVVRRALAFWLYYINASPDALEAETRALNGMVAKVPKPATTSKLKKRPQVVRTEQPVMNSSEVMNSGPVMNCPEVMNSAPTSLTEQS